MNKKEIIKTIEMSLKMCMQAIRESVKTIE